MDGSNYWRSTFRKVDWQYKKYHHYSVVYYLLSLLSYFPKISDNRQSNTVKWIPKHYFIRQHVVFASFSILFHHALVALSISTKPMFCTFLTIQPNCNYQRISINPIQIHRGQLNTRFLNEVHKFSHFQFLSIIYPLQGGNLFFQTKFNNILVTLHAPSIKTYLQIKKSKILVPQCYDILIN